MRHVIGALLCLALLCGAPVIAAAQSPAPPPSEPPIDCNAAVPARALTKSELQTLQLCQEVSKLQEEVEAIKLANQTTKGVLGRLSPFTSLISAFATLVVGILGAAVGFIFRSSFEKVQARKLEQDRIIERERHNIQLFASLDSDNRSVQLATVSALLKRIEYVRSQSTDKTSALLECVTVTDVISSVLRDPNADETVTKYVADEIIDALGARKSPKGNPDKAWRALLPKSLAPFPLSDINFQQTRLRNAYWAGVQASGVDFFKADLRGASLAFADLSRAVLYGTDLSGATLTKANLSMANLKGANFAGARLEGANLSGARNIDDAAFDATTTWDASTVWPQGFDPARIVGAIA